LILAPQEDVDDMMQNGPTDGNALGRASDGPSDKQPKPSCRFGYVSAVVDGGYWLLGGYDGDRWLNDFWKYDLEDASKGWLQVTGVSEKDGVPPESIPNSGYYVNTTDCPSIRSCPCWCIVDFHPLQPPPPHTSPGSPTEPCMLIMGGYDGVNRMNDFYVYGFTSRCWSRMPCRSRQR